MVWASYKATFLKASLVSSTAKPAKKGPKRRNIKTLLTDEQVLDIRRKYEFEGVSPNTLWLEYVEFDVTRRYIRQLLQYQTRSKLFPTEKK